MPPAKSACTSTAGKFSWSVALVRFFIILQLHTTALNGCTTGVYSSLCKIFAIGSQSNVLHSLELGLLLYWKRDEEVLFLIFFKKVDSAVHGLVCCIR